MEAWVGEAFECARRALEARDGQDDETRLALERCAGKYALRALGLIGGEADRYAVASPPSRHSQGTAQPTRGGSGCA